MANKKVKELLKQVKANKRKITVYKLEVGYGIVEYKNDLMVYKPMVAGFILNQVAKIRDDEGNSYWGGLFLGLNDVSHKYFKIQDNQPIILSDDDFNNIRGEVNLKILELESLVHVIGGFEDELTLLDHIKACKPKRLKEIEALKVKRDSLRNYIDSVDGDRYELGLNINEDGSIVHSIIYSESNGNAYIGGGSDIVVNDEIHIPIRLDKEVIGELDEVKGGVIFKHAIAELKKHLYLLDSEINYLESQINN